MAICEKHGEVITHPLGCTRCQWIQSEKNKKAGKVIKFNKFKKSGSKRQSLKVELQNLHSKVMKQLYKDKGLYFCWIDGKGDNRKGLFGLQVSHYFPKGKIWQLWTDPVNSGISSYQNNVVTPETVPLMRRTMVKVWGEEKVNDLEKRAEEFRLRIASGIDPKHPTDIWLMAKIQELKSKLK